MKTNNDHNISHLIPKVPTEYNISMTQIKEDKAYRPISAIVKRPESGKHYKNQLSKNKKDFLNFIPSIPLVDNPILPLVRKNSTKLEKEQLYEEIMQLKTVINNLKKDLALSKSDNVKKTNEINKKDKVIEDIADNSQSSMFNSGSDMSCVSKAKEANLVIKMKKQFKDLKNQHKEKCEELEKLKKTLKFTKINEIAQESKVYFDELNKIKSFYVLSLQQNEINENNLSENLQLKDNINKQQYFILSLQENIQKLNLELKNKEQDFQNLSNQLNQKISNVTKLKKDIKFQNQINERLTKDKNDNSEIISLKQEYERKLAISQKEMNYYKELSDKRDRKIKELDANIRNNALMSVSNATNFSQTNNLDIKYIQDNPEEKSDKLILLLKSKLKELNQENENLRNRNKVTDDRNRNNSTSSYNGMGGSPNIERHLEGKNLIKIYF